MRNENRADRILIAGALIILLIAGGLFYFDEWMWGGSRNRGDVIGMVAKKDGDVRIKFEGDLKWQKATIGDNLVYNDAIYAGNASEAQLNLGETKMTVTQNTLVVLRRDQDVNFLNLNYGTLLGRIAKNDRVVIDTGQGAPIDISTTGGAELILSKVGGETQLDLRGGTAEVIINGEKRKLSAGTQVLLGKQAKLTRNKIKILKPATDEVIFSEKPVDLEFAWGWTEPRLREPNDEYAVEFSVDPSFKEIHFVKQAGTKMSTDVKFSRSMELFYRVRGPDQALSNVQRIRYRRMHVPEILRPLVREQVPAGADDLALVEFEFDKRGSSTPLWYQVSSDPEFKSFLVNQSTEKSKLAVELPVGEYFARVRADYGERLTSWSQPRPFSVAPQPQLRLSRGDRFPTRVVIPNRNYPSRLYSASEEDVRQYLAANGLLRSFFSLPGESIDGVNVQFEDGRTFELKPETTGLGWPVEKLRPDRFRYSYQLSRNGFKPSDWSSPRPLHITMAPPRPVGDPVFNPAGDRVDATWRFTPILFAASYDVQVANEPGFSNPVQFSTNRPLARASLDPGVSHFWRARARASDGRIISEFSSPQRLNVPVTQVLAKNEPKVRYERRPQSSVERVKTKVEREREDDWIHNGWWGWIGLGANFIDYKQAIPGDEGLSLNTSNIVAPSQYVEVGFTGERGYGGVFAYKRTPGEIVFTDGTRVDNPQYTWITTSIEGIMRKISSFKIWNRRIAFGFRAGIQQHRIPFLKAGEDADGNQIAIQKANNITAASLGVLAELNRARWRYYWLMRYQFPLSTTADGANEFAITPTFAFDGSLGLSYNLTKQLKLGAFWYGQWHQFNFVYDDGTRAAGSQSLFYSNMDLRLGWDF